VLHVALLLKVVLAAGNSNFAAVGLKGGELLIYSKEGRRMVPPVALGSTPAMLQVAGEYTVIAVTVQGQLSVMNFINVSGQPRWTVLYFSMQ
jgi:hypothetical protein